MAKVGIAKLFLIKRRGENIEKVMKTLLQVQLENTTNCDKLIVPVFTFSQIILVTC